MTTMISPQDLQGIKSMLKRNSKYWTAQDAVISRLVEEVERLQEQVAELQAEVSRLDETVWETSLGAAE